MKVVSQIAEDVFHIDLRLERIKSNSFLAGSLVMQLAEMLLEDASGISKDCYEKLRYIVDVLPVTDSAKAELFDRVEVDCGRFYVKGECSE